MTRTNPPVRGDSAVKVYRNSIIKVTRTVVLAGAGLGIVVAIFQGHGALLLVLAGVAVWSSYCALSYALFSSPSSIGPTDSGVFGTWSSS